MVNDSGVEWSLHSIPFHCGVHAYPPYIPSFMNAMWCDTLLYDAMIP